MDKRGIILFAVSFVIVLPFAAQAQQSFARELADMASAAADAARERKEQAAAPDAVKAIFAKAEDAAEDGAINFCGFYPGMSEADARTLVAHYGLKDGQWGVDIVPSTKEVFHLSFTLQSIRRITKGGNSFKELAQAVANRIGTLKPKFNDNYDIVGYEYKNIDGQAGFISEKDGLSLLDPTLANKSAEEKAEAERKAAAEKAEVVRKEIEEAAKVALTKLASDMVPIPGKDYAMCKYEVTQALWLAVMGENPARFKGADRPVENVSWNDCQTFLVKLNALPEVKASGRTYRLPTADEWEYACRAGATGGSYGDDCYCKLADGTEINRHTLGEVAWFSPYGLFGIDSNAGTHPVGQKKPNAFGLYDMLGNVWELTSTVEEGSRIRCGGGWFTNAGNCDADYRRDKTMRTDDCRVDGLGFRLAFGK